jgi:hypothetical protein
MKVMIELNIAEGQAIPDAIDIARLTDPDWVASWWHISDIHGQANGWGEDEASDITDDEAREVLRLLEKYHDSNSGINWEVIDGWIDHVKSLRKEKA